MINECIIFSVLPNSYFPILPHETPQEGPMIHSGAVVAAGVSQGRSTTFACDCKVSLMFKYAPLTVT